MGSLIRLGLQQGSLVWSPDMEEASERPPYILMIDNYFAIYQRRRRALISGVAPPGLGGNRPPQARAWRAYQHRMNQEPAWERAERYRRMMREQGSQSIRALARAIGEDHSGWPGSSRSSNYPKVPWRHFSATRTIPASGLTLPKDASGNW